MPKREAFHSCARAFCYAKCLDRLFSGFLSSGWMPNSGNLALGIYTSLFRETIGAVS